MVINAIKASFNFVGKIFSPRDRIIQSFREAYSL